MSIKIRKKAHPGMKWCSYHGKYEPVEAFGPNRAQPDGLQYDCRAGQEERSNTPERRARTVIKDTLRRLLAAYGLTGEVKPLQFYREYIADDPEANPYAQWRVDAFAQMIEAADKQFGRGNWQMDHGVALMRGGEPISPNNLKPMPTAAHAAKTTLDLGLINRRRAENKAMSKARKELFAQITRYCTSTPFIEWHPSILGLADEDQEIEDLLADLEYQSPTHRTAPAIPMPSMRLIQASKGLEGYTEPTGVHPKANRPAHLRIDRRGEAIKRRLGMRA